MELLHLIHLLHWLDRRSLHPLQRWVPDLQEVRDAPAEFFRYREIEIGPWKRYATGYLVPSLLALPALVVMWAAQSLAITACLILILVMLAAALLYFTRGGRCVIDANGVEFGYRGVTVSCPWDLFHAAGQPIYYPDKERLDLPVATAALPGIAACKHESVIAEGLDVRTRHFEILPGAEIRLKVVYGVKPDELGYFLLELGRKLGTRSDRDKAPQSFDVPVFAVSEAGGWIRVSLTRLRFPGICCDCLTATNHRQEFRGHRSLPADAWVRFPVPVCSACQRRNRGRYWRTLAKTMVLAVLGVTVFSFLLGLILDFVGATPDPPAMTVLLTLSGLLCSLGLSWLFAVKRARAVSAPLHLSDYNPGAGTIRLRFRNTKFTELFLASTSSTANTLSR